MTLPDPIRSRAVLIGVDSCPLYPGLRPLPAIRNNITDLAALLTDPEIWGLAPANCTVPTNVSDARHLAATLERAAGEATDTLLVYFAGHGIPDTDDGELILAVGDITERSPKFTGLRYAWVREAVRRSTARRLIVILDCCFSGRALRVMSDPASVVAGQIEIDGTYILTSSPRTSTSLAVPGARYTAFTGGLIKVLREGVVDGPEQLRMTDLYDELLREMVIGGYPRPQQMGTNTVSRLELVRNRWRPDAVPQPRSGRLAAPSIPAEQIAFPGLAETTAAVRLTLGPAGSGDALRIAMADPLNDLGLTMRSQFGDGAGRAVLLTGEILLAAKSELAHGADPVGMVHEVRRYADTVREHLSDLAIPARTASALQLAISTALPSDEIAGKVAAAVECAGPGNVDVASSTHEGITAELTNRLTFTTSLLAPNAAATPVILDRPVVVLSTDGQLDARRLARDPAVVGHPVLIVAPHLAPYLVRALMFTTPQVVVIFPAQEKDGMGILTGLAALTGGSLDGTRPGRAHQVLVTRSTTTVMAGNDRELGDTGHAMVHAGPTALAETVRALAIARAAADGGVVAGGGATLYALRTRLPGDVPAGRVLRRALAAPLREIARNAGLDPTVDRADVDRGTHGFDVRTGRVVDLLEMGIVDPATTVKGAIGHAVATVSRLLTP